MFMSYPLPTDSEAMWEKHRCACGHFALAVALECQVADVVPFFPQLAEGKNWVSTKTMGDALRLAQRPVFRSAGPWPKRGVVLIQGLGSWMRPEVPYVARLSRTHWVATVAEGGLFMLADVNHPEGWLSLADWEESILKPMLDGWKATGWEVSRGYEVHCL